MEERKTRTTIYIDRSLMDLARIEVDNLSQLMETLLSNYLKASSTEEIDKEINALSNKINVLKKKKDDLLRQGIYENKMDGITDSMIVELRNLYKKRSEMGAWNEQDWFNWITAPKNLQRCKMLGKEPLELLTELKEWHQGEVETEEVTPPVNQATVGL